MAIPVDNRRQSGLWAQNPNTGFYEQQQPSQGPYQYYQPSPITKSSNLPAEDSSKPRRSFSERTGNSAISDTYLAAAQNKVAGAGSILDKSRVKDVALATHAKIAASLHAYGGDSKSEDFARASHASAVHSPEQAGAGSRDINSGGSGKPALTVDPNAVPENVRAKPWSPVPDSSGALPLQQTKSRQTSVASEGILRRRSVPDRSPLQKLEGKLDDISKEEKRVRMEALEDRARQKSLSSSGGGGDGLARTNTLRSEKGRVVSDGSGSGRPSESTSDRYYREPPSESTKDRYYRQVSAGAPQALPPQNGASLRFHRASDALKNETQLPYASRNVTDAAPVPLPARERSVRQQVPPIVNNPQPYHHAPPAPRSLAAAHPQSGAPSRIAREAQPYHHAPEQPTSVNVAQYPHNAGRSIMDGSNRRSVSGPAPPSAGVNRSISGASNGDGVNRSVSGASTGDGVRRSGSEKYRHRLRDAGFAGATAAAAAAPSLYGKSAADRGKARYERSKQQENPDYERSPVSPITPTSADLGRSGSKKLQKRNVPTSTEWQNAGGSARDRSMEQPMRGSTDLQRQQTRGSTDIPRQQTRGSLDPQQMKQTLQTNRVGSRQEDTEVPSAHDDPDPIPRAEVATASDEPVNYTIPPQTGNAQAARQQVNFHADDPQRGFGAELSPVAQAPPQEKHHRFGGLFHHKDDRGGRGYVSAQPLDEWKSAKVLQLSAADLEFDRDAATASGKDGAWWEQQERGQRRTSSSAAGPAQYDGPYEEEAKSFRPPLFLKCGPLLRYTGIRREMSSSGQGEREIWRGSIMMVTEDGQSDYSSVPVLRIFAQPMELHTPPSRLLRESGQELPPEDEDPVAGQVKISRTGRPLYVRPVHDIDGGVDLSREENNSGLYAATRTPMLGPQFSNGPDGTRSQHITFQDKSRIKRRDGEKAGRYKEVKAIRLHAEHGFTFWKWSIEIELGSTQHRVAYRINKGPALGFWVPARGDSMNLMFHSCNGFSLSVDPNQFSGPDPLWRDVLNKHQAKPFHAMIGGGDQIYNDAAMRDTTLFREWLQSKNPEWKHHAEFSPEMQEELENFYFHRYSMWFSQGLFAMAGSQIPMINLWDDHDIIDGFGSYPHHFMSSKVFTGLGAVAFKYYMLFQHQSVPAETGKEEPSWVLGASPGPYINERSRSIFLTLGRKVAFLGVDCRTERMRDEILSQASYDILFDRARTEIRKGETKHLIVLLGVPIAYPRLNFLENILTSRMMDPIKAIGRTGMLGGFVNKFDGGVEILDDLDDHWTAKHHKAERNWFIQELQELAAEKSVRVTILGGDVHLGAVGQFYTPRKVGVSKDRDHRYMPNVISSAIVNTPPPPMMADVLNRRNRVHHLDGETDEDLIPMFEVDVDGAKRNNKCLLPRRNYCTIREFAPGSTPPSTPPPERSFPVTPQNGPFADGEYEREERDRRYPPGSMRGRTMSLTRGPAALVRRLSGSRSKNPPPTLGGPEYGGVGRSNTVGGSVPGSGRASFDGADTLQRRPTFLRRPTNMTEKEIRRAAAKGGAPEDEDGGALEPGHIDLEGGLDISLNVEVDQHDPSGSTMGYRLLVPALKYEGASDVNTAPIKSKGASFMDRFRAKGRRDEEEDDYSDGSETPSPPPSRGQTQQVWQPTNQPPPASSGGRVLQKPYPAGYGADGAYDSAPPRRSVEQSGTAYNQGYNLSSPPLGASQSRSPTGLTSNNNNNPYPQSSNYRRASAPVSQKHSQQVPGPYGRGPDEYSEDSLTPSEDYDERPPGRTPAAPPRRGSKAERFFGIGDEGGARRPSMQENNGYDDGRAEKSRPKWMVWR